MKTKTILIILAILAAIVAIFFLVKKPKNDMGLLEEPTSINTQTSTSTTGTTPMMDEQTVIVEPAPVESTTPEFPTTGVKPE